jgi:DNA-binding CsgD family transcriptional regulator/tetratricopeptide (TPR) repeat protein
MNPIGPVPAGVRLSGKDLVAMADGDEGTPVAGRLVQPTLWRPVLREAGGRLQSRPGLLDRRPERAAIDRVLDAVRAGFSGTLVLLGGDGAGKTTLLEYAIDSAADLRLTSAVGVESEISLEFAALHQLLVPFMPFVATLPTPQRNAIKVAFGVEEGPPPDLFLVGLAALTLLSRAAEDQPLLCVIDDGHWLDRESARVLGFVARRLYADRVGLIAAVGESAAPQVIGQLPAITVGSLPDAEARELLGSVIDGPLDAQVADRILADTHNNPLALAELGAEYTAEQLAGRASLPEPLPLSQRLRDRFLGQVRNLPPDAQAFVLLAAADVTGERGRLWRAAAQAGIDADTAAADAADVLEISGNWVRFRHPLLRSAAYHGATDADRRRAHTALSETANLEGDLDQRAWHRATAAVVPEEEIAAELQQAAERARGRGGCTTVAALLRRSVELTPDDSARAKREVALAGAELRAGHAGQARELVRAAIPRLADDAARGLAKRLNGQILFAEGSAAEAVAVLADASRALAPDGRLARDTLLEALEAAIWAGPAETRKIAGAAQALPPAPSPPSVTDLLLEGYCARLTAGYSASVGPLRAAVTALRADDLDPAVGLRWFALGVAAAGSLWDEQAVFDLSDRWVRTARALGALTILPVALASLAISDWLTGRFGDADARWAEMLELLAEGHRPRMLGIDSRCNGLLLAYRGHLTEARAAGVAQVRESTARGQQGPAELGRYIVAVADLFGGDYQAATSAALPVVDDDPAFTAELCLPELIEAATRAGDRAVAATAHETLSQRALAAGTPWALGLRARCQALLDDSGHAEDAYQESVSQLARSRATVELARTHLLYGQWLRRAKRRRDARQQLRTAQDMFTAMGAGHFIHVAGTELRATGERARARTPETTFDLTPQEARVAGLAAGGASNNEIAAQLFLSPATVDYHLRKVFRKLNVTSRTQLARSLGPAPAGQSGEAAG